MAEQMTFVRNFLKIGNVFERRHRCIQPFHSLKCSECQGVTVVKKYDFIFSKKAVKVEKNDAF